MNYIMENFALGLWLSLSCWTMTPKSTVLQFGHEPSEERVLQFGHEPVEWLAEHEGH